MPNLNWHDVDSSNLEAVAFNDTSLYVRFKNGSTYRYKEVPPEIFEQLLKADSHGKFFHQNVRSNYEYERL